MYIEGTKTENVTITVSPYSVITALQEHYGIKKASHLQPGQMEVTTECLASIYNNCMIHGEDWRARVITEDEDYIKLFDLLKELEVVVKNIETKKKASVAE